MLSASTLTDSLVDLFTNAIETTSGDPDAIYTDIAGKWAECIIDFLKDAQDPLGNKFTMPPSNSGGDPGGTVEVIHNIEVLDAVLNLVTLDSIDGLAAGDGVQLLDCIDSENDGNYLIKSIEYPSVLLNEQYKTLHREQAYPGGTIRTINKADMATNAIQSSLVEIFKNASTQVPNTPLYFASGLINAVANYIQLGTLEFMQTPGGIGVSNIIVSVLGAPAVIPPLVMTLAVPSVNIRPQASAIAQAIMTLITTTVTMLIYLTPTVPPVPTTVIQSLQ